MELWRSTINSQVESLDFKPDIDALVLDGIPRNLNQARLMEELIDVKHAFHLSCPNREELITRLRQRALHDNRLDDANEAVIRKRLRTYELETRPMLEFYGVKVTIIDATEPPIKVLNDITSIIWSKQRKVAA
jgi:adenylate kinase